jgi:thiol:disulfide interchange protein DsbC
MMKYLQRMCVFVAAAVMPLLVAQTAVAGEAEDVKAITAALTKVNPGAKPDSIKPSVIPGLYEAVYGPQVIYVSKDGAYLFEGDLFDVKRRLNLTEQKREKGRAAVVNSIDPKTMIIFAPEGETKYTINAFTDIDCGYCRKLHKQIDEYNKLGIAIRYLSFPRAGVNSKSYEKAVSVWCSDDRKKAITLAKAGQTPEKKTCDNPVKDHMAAAREVGVTGTPSLVLESGKLLPGYVEPKRLLQILDQLKHG